jgi:ParB/RepB/Spo0J family partition protein
MSSELKNGRLKVEYVDIDTLKPSEYNPRKSTKKEYENLKQSIERFGLVDPIIVNSAENRENIVIGGHFRLKVAKDLGIKQVPVVYVNIPDIEKEKELNLRLNKNLGEWDFDLLVNFDEDLLKSVGFTEEELSSFFKDTIENLVQYEDVRKAGKYSVQPSKYRQVISVGTYSASLEKEYIKQLVEYLEAREKRRKITAEENLREIFDFVLKELK